MDLRVNLDPPHVAVAALGRERALIACGGGAAAEAGLNPRGWNHLGVAPSAFAKVQKSEPREVPCGDAKNVAGVRGCILQIVLAVRGAIVLHADRFRDAAVDGLEDVLASELAEHSAEHIEVPVVVIPV